MANRRLSDLPEKINIDENDYLLINDVSDPTESPEGTSKKAKKGNIGANYVKLTGVDSQTIQTDINIDGAFVVEGTSTTVGTSISKSSAADTDNVLVVQNGSGSNTFSVTGEGNVSANNILDKRTIAQIRAFTGTLPNNHFYTTDTGKEGTWYYDSTDTTSADNTGTVLVTADGKRIKRVISNKIQASWFGFKADGLSATSTANATALQAAIDFCATLPITHTVEFQGYEIQLPLGDAYCEQVIVKGSCMIVGQGKTTTRLFFVGTDYFLKGNVAFISNGGLRDLQINPANGNTPLGLVYLKNAYNMTYKNVTLNGAVSGAYVTEAVVKLESQESWTVGANNNIYGISFENLNIYGSGGYGINVTGDYGSANISIKNSVLENIDNYAVFVTSTSGVRNTGFLIENTILQGGQQSPLRLDYITGAKINAYFELTGTFPAILLGDTYRNIVFDGCNIGASSGFGGGAIIKAANSFSGTSLSNNGVIISNCSFTTTNTNDFISELYARNVELKNMNITGTTKIFSPITYVDDGNNGLGGCTIDLTNLTDVTGFNYTEVSTGASIPKGKISYFQGAHLVGTNTKQQVFLTSDGSIGKNDINSDVFLTGVSNLSLGSKNQYYSRKHFMYSLHNLSSGTVTVTINDGGLINGSGTYILQGYSSIDIHHSNSTSDLYAIEIPSINSPTFTGTPTAPTATADTNTTQIATTAFVQNAVSSGSYTPAFTNVLNVASTTLTNAYYTKIGDIVTVTVGLSITPTSANTNTVLKIDLPFARSVSTTTNIGTSVSGDNTLHLAGNVQTSGDTTTASLYFYPTTTNSYVTSVSFQYKLN